jgi:ribosomal 50S subunit-recycling heat shock protein
MRLDKYLKVSRLIKRRTLANEACDAGRVQVNQRVARASYEVKQGDVITIALGGRPLKIRVLAVSEHVGKNEAAALYAVVDHDAE